MQSVLRGGVNRPGHLSAVACWWEAISGYKIYGNIVGTWECCCYVSERGWEKQKVKKDSSNRRNSIIANKIGKTFRLNHLYCKAGQIKAIILVQTGFSGVGITQRLKNLAPYFPPWLIHKSVKLIPWAGELWTERPGPSALILRPDFFCFGAF